MPYKDKKKKRNNELEKVHRNKYNFFCGKSCSKCGSKTRLLLHHVDPLTKISSGIWNWGEQRRNEEISKCIILCCSCHSKLNNKEKYDRYNRHGTTYSYNIRKCRCEICRTTESKRVMKYQQRDGVRVTCRPHKPEISSPNLLPAID